MRDFIDIGSAPAEEDCVSVSRDVDYLPAMRAECLRFIELIRKTLGPEPEGAHLAVKSNPHDFGTYYEVVCYFQDDDDEARKYAFRCQDDAPATWDAKPKPPPENSREVLQCADCNLTTIARDFSARDVFCDCCGRQLWRATASDAQAEALLREHTNGPETERPSRSAGVCDSCIEAAAEHGIPDRVTQAEAMILLGADMEDHHCDQVEAPDLGLKCGACRSR